ncbi:beta-1,4-galactosyltransferase 3-like [Paramacrobiotus metropolitanus]|uniref:beta-1,4-galactosyltransferase 3-like n=1 Tax=Paramacrobiotus metropolitanus TaxID=2943436 RepID=UPI0024464DEF|nr:beta-1,4-galactosyltransferase 3-like [Paramacrobiotus metropolitanus]
MVPVRTLQPRDTLCRVVIIAIVTAFSLTTFSYILFGNIDGRVGCPTWLIFMTNYSKPMCSVSGYYDSKTQHARRLLIFYDMEQRLNGSSARPLCGAQPATLIGRRNISLVVRSDQNILADNPLVQNGGAYRPSRCEPRHSFRLAVIVAFRDRQQHLQILLNNLHPFLQRQQLEYTIFVVEQAGNATFNRGKLFNVGFREAEKFFAYSCLVFHDVDLLPENDGNSYSCPQEPTLLCSAIEKFKYLPLPDHHLGGVVSFSSQHFRQVNGFPNLYWGWGGEDDDLSQRVRARIGKLRRAPLDVGQYTMIKHARDTGNPINPQRFTMVGTAAKRFATDGLSSLSYTVIKLQLKPLYTWILVDIGQPI